MTIAQMSFAGQTVPAIGLGTWFMGQGAAPRQQEADAIRAGLDAGLRVVDTAEMYADGGAEEVVGEALQERRDDALLVSKVYPHNASRQGVKDACERSLRRLRTDRIDVYLLHWMGRYPLSETVAGFQDLVDAGKIGAWGVSNLDPQDIAQLLGVPGGRGCTTNQVLYNLTRRGPELDLFPAMRQAKIPAMAYSPLEQARLFDAPGAHVLMEVAEQHRATPAQVALAWCVRDGSTLAIPKSADPDRVRENARALELDLSPDDLDLLHAAFPAPSHPIPLQTL